MFKRFEMWSHRAASKLLFSQMIFVLGFMSGLLAFNLYFQKEFREAKILKQFVIGNVKYDLYKSDELLAGPEDVNTKTTGMWPFKTANAGGI